MSVTITETPPSTEVRPILADYRLYHSQPPDEEAEPAPEPNEQILPPVNNPSTWETEWRRIPPHRPVRNQLDEQRNTYNNVMEQSFIWAMLHGVEMMGVSESSDPGVRGQILIRCRMRTPCGEQREERLTKASSDTRLEANFNRA